MARLSHIADGNLIRVLTDWCPFFPEFNLYYSSRRQPTPAFTVLAHALRQQAQLVVKVTMKFAED
jgi:DNA-binding transcriptional LysR family regulator